MITTGSIIKDDSNDYEVLNEIGSGGFGRVFKIKRKSDNVMFALKTIDTDFPNPAVLDSFENEARLALSISHQNVVKYIYYHNGQKYSELLPYIIMELVEGISLREFIDKQTKTNSLLSNDILLNMISQIIDGMSVINQKVIHRDIKPENMLYSQGNIKITDFGLAKISEDSTRTHSFKGSGTYPYMAPEAWTLETNTINMDIYSVGLLFYELATLKMPFIEYNPNTYEDWKSAHLYKQLKSITEINPKISLPIQTLIESMTKKNKNQRINDWTKIKSHLTINPISEESRAVSDIISEKIKRDREVEIKEIERQKLMRMKKEKEDLVESQFKDSVVDIIDAQIKIINSGLIDKNYIKSRTNGLLYELIIGMKTPITIKCKTIYEEDFYKDIEREWLGRTIRKKELILPRLRDKEILCWGEIKSDSGIGFNLLLVKENPADIYGQWLLLTNTNNALVNKPRLPEPFVLNSAELERKLQVLNALDIYDTKVEQFTITPIMELIKKHI